MSVEHAVMVEFALDDERLGSDSSREAFRVCSERVQRVLETSGLGYVDGDEFGGGMARLYLYGKDASLLFEAIVSILKSGQPRAVSALLRFGDVTDKTAEERRVIL